MEYVKDYWGVIALIIATGWALIKTYFKSNQTEEAVLELKVEFKEFKKQVYDELEHIHEKQIKATERLAEVLDRLSKNVVRLEESNKNLKDQVSRLEDKIL